MDAVLARPRLSQAVIGLSFAAAIILGWLAIHVYAMFAFRITAANWPLVAVIAAVQCWLSVGMFIVAHDAMHGSLAPGRSQLNAVVGAGVMILYAGFGWSCMRDAHFAHHRRPGTAEDPDFDADHPSQFWPWYTTFLRRYFGWQSAAYVGAIVTLYWAVLGVPVENVVLLYGLPALASSVQLFYFGTYRTHRHDEHGFDDRHNARTEEFGTLTSLATCFHFGYHHEHHMSPNVPWWALPARRRASMVNGADR